MKQSRRGIPSAFLRSLSSLEREPLHHEVRNIHLTFLLTGHCLRLLVSSEPPEIKTNNSKCFTAENVKATYVSDPLNKTHDARKDCGSVTDLQASGGTGARAGQRLCISGSQALHQTAALWKQQV